MNKDWLPSEKLVSVFFVVAVIFGVYFFVFKNDNKATFSFSSNQDDATKINKTDEDTDGDGLMDWEEFLLKTDSNNPDTDGDGISDKDEFKKDNRLTEEGFYTYFDNYKKELENRKDLNRTDLASKDLLIGYIGLKQAGLLTDTNKEKLIDSIVLENVLESSSNKYSISDIKTTNNSQDSVKTYYDKIVSVLGTYTNGENDLLVLKRALENNDSKEIEKLKKSAINYINLQNELVKIITPSDLVNNHLNIVTILGNLIKNIEDMSLSMEDPLRGLTGAKKYFENQEKFVGEFFKIGTYLKDNNIN
ncbi:hypothetical protein A2442_00095 [Candidatus Campbellbacteria bacterium RIFOXYC2_FULL_35_25]|uniref:EF-hand domain-containing protein n=1 Tax=Candidatus Campbellbacteria bacterium RIFOXYC2_FULL_35_25 TaxID=1797582 RepID=A0A1F5EIC1_9BACT|nr:MAG: hypothetical protein A2442_00095 [Candidatus Campbellbacteria bacterium RIFOXYC2_FULL_35_25]